MDKKTRIFYSPKNEKGKSVIVATRIAPETNVVLERIVESGTSPWQSKSELIRDAISNFIEQYATQDDLVPQVLSVVRKLQERSFRSEVKERIAETVCASSRELKLYLETKEYARLAEELEDVCSIILSLRDDPFWLKLTVMEFVGDPTVQEAFKVVSENLGGCTAEVLRIAGSIDA